MAWRSDDQNLCDKRIAPIVNVRWKLFFAVVMTTAFVFGAGSAFAASPRKYDCVKNGRLRRILSCVQRRKHRHGLLRIVAWDTAHGRELSK